MEQLGISIWWVLVFPAVVLVGYALVLVEGHKSAKKAAADRLASAKGAADALQRITHPDYINHKLSGWDKAKDENFDA